MVGLLQELRAHMQAGEEMSKELVVRFYEADQTLRIHERDGLEPAKETQILEFSFRDNEPTDLHQVEQTLGQLLLFSLNRLTPGGLGFGSYDDLLERISADNLAAFAQGLNLNNAKDQYDLATIMFSHGRRVGSWAIVERAIGLYRTAAQGGHKEALRFVEEDLPVVLPRVEQKLKPKA